MIKYADLVDYIKKEHVNWNTDLFEVLRGFFEQYCQPHPPSPSHSPQQEINWKIPEVLATKKFEASANGEYTSEDLINLFSS